MSGNYHTLEKAVKFIENSAMKKNKKARMIAILNFINQARGVNNAKEKALGEGFSLSEFRSRIRELTNYGINPVTIPREWGIKFIPNLLEAYHKLKGRSNIEPTLSEIADSYIDPFDEDYDVEVVNFVEKENEVSDFI
jgi:hypothetical protein